MRFLKEIHRICKVGVEIVNAWHRQGDGIVGNRPGCHDFDHGVETVLVLMVLGEVIEGLRVLCGERKRLSTFFLLGSH